MKAREPFKAMLDSSNKLADRRSKTFRQPNYVKFDVMLNDRYVCTMRYRHLPVFAISEKEIVDYVISQRPSLKNKPFTITF